MTDQAHTHLGSFAQRSVQRCPYPFIASLHAEAPVYLDPLTGFHIVSRYDDIAYVLQEVELSGVTLPVGATIQLSYLAGNYDPARYPDGAAVDLDRKGLRNHLAFSPSAPEPRVAANYHVHQLESLRVRLG